MQITELSGLGLSFDRRLRVALDRIVPPSPLLADARFRSRIPGRGATWRLTPALVGIALIAILAASATLATGTPNPVVWTQRAAATIQSVRQEPAPKLKPASIPKAAAPSTQRSPASHATTEPNREAEPTQRPEPSDGAESSPRPDSSQSPPDDSNPPDSSGSSGDSGPTSSYPLPGGGGGWGGRQPSDFGGDQRF